MDSKQREIIPYYLDIRKDRKRCNIFEIFIKWGQTYCPCCHYKLRTRLFRDFGMNKYYREEAIKRY